MKLFHLPLLLLTMALMPYSPKHVSKKMIPNPPGAAYIPSVAGDKNSYAFYVMKEPVMGSDFTECLQWLFNTNRMDDANICLKALSNGLDKNSDYIHVSNKAAIAIFAEYYGQKISNKYYTYQCRLITSQEWKRIKGASGTAAPKSKNAYGIKFPFGGNEWKTDTKGKEVPPKEVNSKKIGAFRLILTVTINKSNG